MRHKLIALAMIVAVPAAALAQPSDDTQVARLRQRLEQTPILDGLVISGALAQLLSCDVSTAEGRQAANDEHHTGRWMWGGAAALLFPIGTIPVAIAAKRSNPQPRILPAGVDEPCYRDGYRSRARHRNFVAMSIGAAILSAVVVLGLAAGNPALGYQGPIARP
jgi:hypothetical protein